MVGHAQEQRRDGRFGSILPRFEIGQPHFAEREVGVVLRRLLLNIEIPAFSGIGAHASDVVPVAPIGSNVVIEKLRLMSEESKIDMKNRRLRQNMLPQKYRNLLRLQKVCHV